MQVELAADLIATLSPGRAKPPQLVAWVWGRQPPNTEKAISINIFAFAFQDDCDNPEYYND